MLFKIVLTEHLFDASTDSMKHLFSLKFYHLQCLKVSQAKTVFVTFLVYTETLVVPSYKIEITKTAGFVCLVYRLSHDVTGSPLSRVQL